MKIQDLKSYKYANDIITGKTIASKYNIMAAERFMNDLERDDLIFDLSNLNKVNTFLEQVIYIPELKKKNVVFPPHAFWIDQIYGFKYKDSGLRKYTSAYNQFARKNFKTFYAAAITLVEALLWKDKYPEILQGANSRDQALICTTKTAEIIKNSPALKNKWNANNTGELRLYYNKDLCNTIVFENGNRKAVIKAIPRDLGDGGNPSIGIIDEFHEAKSTNLLETIKSGQGQRFEPFTLIITSAGTDRSSVCYDERILSEKILTGEIIDDRHLSILFELDHEDEWDQIEMLEKSNPMMPYVPTLNPYLENRIKEAKKYGGAKRANIVIKNCGIWIDAPEVWIESEKIKKNNHGIDTDRLKDVPVYIGFDLAKGKDLNALAIMGEVDGFKVVKMHYWIPEDKLDDDSDKVDYRRFHELGFMHVMPGDTINMIDLGEEIADILSQYQQIEVIGFDVKYSYMGVVPVLAKNGYEEKLVPVGQGFNLSPSTIQLSEWISLGQMDFGSNPVLEWNFSNVTLKVGNKDDVYPAKEKDYQKIDGVIALCIAIEEYLRMNSETTSEIFIGGL